MTPDQWNQTLAKPYHEARPIIAAEVKAWLDHCPLQDGDMIEGKTLIEYLYPERYARGEGITLRRRLFEFLRKVATDELKEYATKSPPRKMRFRKDMVGVWLWHHARPLPAIKRCPTCHQEIK